MYDLISFGFDYVMPNVHEIYGKSLSNRNMKRCLHLLCKEKVANFPLTFVVRSYKLLLAVLLRLSDIVHLELK